MSCMLECWKYLYFSGHMLRAFDAANQFGILAQRTNHRFSIRRSEILRGLVFADTGNIAEAIVHFARALEIADQMDDDESRASALNNLAVAFTYGGWFREAVQCC